MTASTEFRLDATEEKCYTTANSRPVTNNKFKLYCPRIGKFNCTSSAGLGVTPT